MLTEKLHEQAFLRESTELMESYDRKNFQNNLNYYKEGIQDMVSVVVIKSGKAQTHMIEETLSSLRDVSVETRPMADFFEGIHDSQKLDDIPISTKVYDMSIIDKLRPQYLSQMTIDIGLVVDKFLKKTLSKVEIEKLYMTPQYVTNCKKQIAKTSIPYELNPKDMYKYDFGTICTIDETFIVGTILPFLRNIPQTLKELEILTANVISTISKGYEDVSLYATTADKLFSDGKISMGDYRFLNKFLYVSIRNFMTVASYLSFLNIRKIGVVSANIRNYKELQIKILNYFPEGDQILHESVLDGSFTDIDMGSLVNDVLMNNNSTFRAAIQSIVSETRSDIAYAMGRTLGDDDHNEINMTIPSYEFSDDAYQNAQLIFDKISASIDSLMANAKDPVMPFDDIIEKSGLSSSLIDRFSAIISNIPSTSYYENILATPSTSAEDKQMILFMALNEISSSESYIDQIVSKINANYQLIRDMEDDLSNGDNAVYHNPETLKELIAFTTNMDADFRQVVLSVVKALSERLKNLTHVIKEVKNEICVNPDVNLVYGESDESFFDMAYEAECSIDDEVNALVFESYLREYHKARTFYETGMHVVYEEGLATSQQAQNNNEKPATPADTKKTLAERIKHIIDIIRSFFKKSTDTLQEIVTKQSGNLETLQKNKDAIVNRSYAGITVNVLPYEKYVNEAMILKDIQTMTNNINGLTEANLKSYTTRKAMHAYLFSFLENGSGNAEDVTETLKKYYKVKNAKLEVMPYKGGQAKTLAPIMVDYCISFYSNFNQSLTTALNSLQKATEDKLASFENLNESVMYEVEGNASAQPAAQPATQEQPAKSTKPSVTSVQSDKKTDAKVTGKVDGEKAGNNGIYNMLKWISMDVQQFSSSVLTAARDRNYDYLKIIDSITPKAAKASGTEAQPTEQPAQNTENTTQQQAQPAQ